MATGIKGSFADPNVAVGGASSGIGFGTNAVYASAKDCPMGDAQGKAVGVHTIGEPVSAVDRKAYCLPGDPLQVLVIKEAEQDTADGESLGNRPLNGKPVTNETGVEVKDGQFVIGVNAL